MRHQCARRRERAAGRPRTGARDSRRRYVASTPEFTDQPAVINGASELLRDVLGEERGVGTRLALGVTSLPANSPVEFELILETG